jgi:hypothetical protein
LEKENIVPKIGRNVLDVLVVILTPALFLAVAHVSALTEHLVDTDVKLDPIFGAGLTATAWVNRRFYLLGAGLTRIALDVNAAALIAAAYGFIAYMVVQAGLAGWEAYVGATALGLLHILAYFGGNRVTWQQAMDARKAV